MDQMQNDNPKKAEDSVIMTVKDVAEYLRMSEAKVYRLVKGDLLPAVRIGKTWRFRKDLLNDWLEECSRNEGKLSRE